MKPLTNALVIRKARDPRTFNSRYPIVQLHYYPRFRFRPTFIYSATSLQGSVVTFCRFKPLKIRLCTSIPSGDDDGNILPSHWAAK